MTNICKMCWPLNDAMRWPLNDAMCWPPNDAMHWPLNNAACQQLNRSIFMNYAGHGTVPLLSVGQRGRKVSRPGPAKSLNLSVYCFIMQACTHLLQPVHTHACAAWPIRILGSCSAHHSTNLSFERMPERLCALKHTFLFDTSAH